MRNLQERSQIALISLPHLCTSPSPSALALHQPPIHPPKPLCTQHSTSLDSCILSPTWQSHPCTFSPSLAALMPHLPHQLCPLQATQHLCQTLMPHLPCHSFTLSHLATACCTHTILFLSFNVLLPHLLGHSHTSLATEAPFSTRQQHPRTLSSSFVVFVPCFPHLTMAHQELQELLS